MQVLLIFAFVAAVSGATPKPCCMNHKWNGMMMQVGAMKGHTSTDPNMIDNMFMMDYDYEAKMTMLVGMTLDQSTGMMHNLTVFDDYAHGKRYTVYDGQCSVGQVHIDSMTPPCVPGNFTYEGSYTLGGGMNMMTVSSFSGFAAGAMTRITMTDDCLPVAMTQYGSTPDGSADYIYSYIFSNVTMGALSKANPFTAPTHCKEESLQRDRPEFMARQRAFEGTY